MSRHGRPQHADIMHAGVHKGDVDSYEASGTHASEEQSFRASSKAHKVLRTERDCSAARRSSLACMLTGWLIALCQLPCWAVQHDHRDAACEEAAHVGPGVLPVQQRLRPPDIQQACTGGASYARQWRQAGYPGISPGWLPCSEAINMLDLRKPHLWYPVARSLQRRLVYHMGPTNSGKTYNALQAMRAARSGVYCGPLRLLAMEIYDELNASGTYCNLITGALYARCAPADSAARHAHTLCRAHVHSLALRQPSRPA